MFLVDEFDKMVLNFIGGLFFVLTVFFTAFYQVEIVFIAFKEEFVSEVYTVFVSTHLVKSVHIQLQIN